MLSASKTAAPSTGGYSIQKSVRLRSSATAYLSRTYTNSNTSSTKQTFSVWAKRGVLGSADSMLFGGYDGSSSASFFVEFNTDKLNVQFGGSTANNITSNAVYRDPSSWYHVVLAIDTTQSTASNRMLLYVNGVQVTSFSATNYPSQNATVQFGLTNGNNKIGSAYQGLYNFDGYLTEINFIDGQALTPTSFGAFNATTGVWQPIKYTGTYGTNGFYLNFSNNASTTTLGYDTSGNGNNWTTNNISLTAGSTYDSMTDVPTLTSATASNYAVLNPLLPSSNSNGTIADGGLTTTISTSGYNAVSFMGMSSGKFYWEYTWTYNAHGLNVGIDSNTNFSGAQAAGALSTGYGYYNATGNKYNNNTGTSYGTAWYTSGNTYVIGVAFDATNGTLTFYLNGVSQGTAFTGIPAGTYFPSTSFGSGSGSSTVYFNFGQQPFAYTPPSGFVALNTYNLPTPTIKNGAAYMAATTWTGVSTSSAITVNNGTNNTLGVTFQPDFVWGKTRSLTYNNQLYDSVRGTGKLLISNTTDAQQTNFTYGYVSAFNSNGFTASPGATDNENWNTTSATYVAWQWSKGNTQGFAIVSQTLSTTGINTITHNLGVVPTMVIAKRTDATEAWLVYQSSGTTQSQYLSLNSTAAVASSANLWGSSAFTSTQIYFNGTSGNTYVFYIYAPVAGFSKFGSYTGNGSTDGPFVFTNFRPRWIMVKRTDSTGDWYVYDTSRGSYNATNAWLQPDTSSAENSSTSWEFDILSNGFKVRNNGAFSNASGGTYIYAAFAENPFNYSLAR